MSPLSAWALLGRRHPLAHPPRDLLTKVGRPSALLEGQWLASNGAEARTLRQCPCEVRALENVAIRRAHGVGQQPPVQRTGKLRRRGAQQAAKMCTLSRRR
eukprot:CAMPEP_0175624742 /NCGR_PEP_ID=MMETSP0096-20121207/70115_1 /TAXON_ID=311494 /ORGANISM="Alexandrium monilatum, Strain CCMP3105" /LENGTH=100 /DNA_ID=CAMNT_0016930067 /DNA_START=12 /DNA_END=310 /DNA_ORIENTATION=-